MQSKIFKRVIKIYWITFLLGLLTCLLIFILISNGTFGRLPDLKQLEDPKSNLATQILSSDMVLLGTYFKENRTNVAYDQISPHVIQALISTEDERYYKHSGIDAYGLTRAIFFLGKKGGASTISQQLAKLLFTENKADKITVRVIQKLKEWIIAVQLEKRYTKEEILEMYLNRFDFVNHAVGIKSAANIYFSKEPDQLNIQESAMLVGMLQNPSLYNPLKRAEKTLNRRNVVLGQMLRNKYITPSQLDSLKNIELGINYKSVDHKEGIATYFREVLRSEVSKLLEEKDGSKYKIRKTDGEKYDIYKDGLKIYTTIDSRMQKYAEWAVQEHLRKELQPAMFNNLKRKKNAPFDHRLSQKEIDGIIQAALNRTPRYRALIGKECANCGRGYKYIEKITVEGKQYFHCKADDCGHNQPVFSDSEINKIMNTPVKMKVFSWNGPIDTVLSPIDSLKYYKSFLQAGFMSMDPHTGHIKAWVGGIDFKNFSFDHVKQSKRQVGSTFKPLVYALAIQEGYSPCKELPNVITCFDMPEGQPSYCPKNSDEVYGCNVTLKYAFANSINTVTAQLMKQLSPQAVVEFSRKIGVTSHLDPVPSLCLGVADLSVYELVGANATFANKGIWIEPIFITKIEDKNGNILYENFPKKVQAMNEHTSYAMLDLMKGVTDGAYNKCQGDKGGYYRSGTGVRIRSTSRPYGGIKYPIAGKTGTTQNNSDGWFIGITPDLVSGCWVGAEDRAVRFSQTNLGQGANTALPIWGYFMNKVYSDTTINISKGDFERPVNFSIELDCNKFKENNQVIINEESEFSQ